MTEPQPSRIGHRTSLSWRIIVWTLLVSGVGIAALLTTTMAAMKHSAEVGSNGEIVQEIEEMRAFASSGLDPVTGQPFKDARAFLDTYLARQQPGRGEIFVGHTLQAGVTGYRLGEGIDSQAGRDLLTSADVVNTISRQQSGIIETNLGNTRWGRTDIVRGDTQAAFIVVHLDTIRFTDQDRTLKILWPLAASSLIATAIAAVLLSRVIIRPLQVLERDVALIEDHNLTRRVEVVGNDEVAALATAFNHMMDRLEESFKTQRRFLDDAGHELRTPITVVRGHLELLGDDPEERQETVNLVLAELDRMNRMVTDLLALAKAEQPDFIRCDAPVDIAQLTLDLDAKVMSIADRVWTVDEVADGEAVVDEQRITQAVMQLAQNAVQHTTDGDMISLSTRFVTIAENQWLEIRCADSGEGVDDDDKKHLFDRFRRGSTTNRNTLGAGLGLSIVHAIATGHSGSVTVDDTPGGGATFILRVPRWCNNEHCQETPSSDE